MINNIVKILLFLLVNAAGWYTAPTIYVLATMWNVMPAIPESADPSFTFLAITMMIPIWACSALASIGYFFAASPETRLWLLLAPIYVPAIYLISVLTYFHFI